MIKRKEGSNNMRKTMSKEITTTTLKLGKIKVIDGSPIVEQLPDETLIGTPNDKLIGRMMFKKHGAGVTVYSKEVNKLVYEMSVEDFIKYGVLKGYEEQQAEEAQETKEAESTETENTGSTIIVRQRRG
jgi:hypothetical protein